jgi:hypothetical protein
MPVPAGVWEAVGSSIGTKAIVATKIAGLKLLILKTLAGIVLAGGAGFGIYELVKTNTNETVKIDQPIIVNQSSPLEMAIDTVFPAQISESDNTVTRKFVLNEDSMITYSKTETSGAKESENSNFDNNVPKATEVAVPKPLIETKAPEKQVEPNKVAEPTKEAPKTEPIVTPAFPEPPNVYPITPNKRLYAILFNPRPSHRNHPRWSVSTNDVFVSPVVGFVRATVADEIRIVEVIILSIH